MSLPLAMHMAQGNGWLEKAEMCCTLFVWEAVTVCMVQHGATGCIDNVGCYVLFIFKRACPVGNSEVVNGMHNSSVRIIPNTHQNNALFLLFSSPLPLLRCLSLIDFNTETVSLLIRFISCCRSG